MTRRQHLRLALDGQHPRLGRSVELALLALVVVSALGMGVETLSGLPDWAYAALGVLETVVIVAFALEYVLRLAVAERPWRYVTSFYGVIDLLSFLPSLIGFFHAGSVLDARALRTLRLLRLLRLLKIARYANAADRLQDAWRLVKDEVIVFGLAALAVLYVCALIIYQFENEAQPEAFSSVFSAMWWAAVTLTTVGYGDIYPITSMGRIFTVLMLFVALGVIAIPTGLVASAMSELRKRPPAKNRAAPPTE
jgi:voltage-gated potassium channel